MAIDLNELSRLEERREALENELQSPELARNQRAYSASARKLSELSKLISVWRKLIKTQEDIEDAKLLLADPNAEMRQMAQAEIEALTEESEKLDEELKVLLLPKDPNDDRNTIVEIRAATGGDEAALFAADLYRMYARFAESQGWRVEILNSNPT
ncbi:MAG: PCRF domain-containing protein, partial [Deltaproteobacteria bacterium]|nr:PCRF domain-containing protein [Deltaproteobacteria bacterium]